MGKIFAGLFIILGACKPSIQANVNSTNTSPSVSPAAGATVGTLSPPIQCQWSAMPATVQVEETGNLAVAAEAVSPQMPAVIEYALDTVASSCLQKSWDAPLTVNSRTGRIEGSPSLSSAGSCLIVVKASCGNDTVVGSIVLQITPTNRPPVWTAEIAELSLFAGEGLDLAVGATDPDGLDSKGLTYSLDPESSCLQGHWLAMPTIESTSGRLTGKPSSLDLGDCIIKTRVSDGTATVSRSIVVHVTSPESVVMNWRTLPGSIQVPAAGTAQATLVADVSGTQTPPSYAIVGDESTCPGKSWSTPLSVNPATGALTGVAGAGNVGQCTLVVQASVGVISIKGTISIDVLPVNHPPVWAGPVADQTVIWGHSLDVAALANDADAGDQVAYSIDASSSCSQGLWMSAPAVDAATGHITGTPSQSDLGACQLKIKASDGEATVSLTFAVQVVNPIACDSGTWNTTCVVNSDKGVLPDGARIFGTGNLQIGAGGVISADPETSIQIEMGGNLIIDAGGTIAANLTALKAQRVVVNTGGSLSALGKGFKKGATYNAKGHGLGGAAAAAYQGGAGGSHAGVGGDGSYGGKPGGTAIYGSDLNPVDWGSAGGHARQSNGEPYAKGGNGGGAIKIEAAVQLLIDGSVSAAGENGEPGLACDPKGGGGGAGGSIWMVTGSMEGTGTVSAAGGAGGRSDECFNPGASGGGGRIAIAMTSSSFGGTMDVSSPIVNSNTDPGAAGGQGGSGTIRLSLQNLCDTGSLSDTCVVSSPKWLGNGQTFNGASLTVANGGKILVASPEDTVTLTFTGDVAIQAGGRIHANLSALTAANITIDAGATVDTDGLGYSGGRAPTSGSGPAGGFGVGGSAASGGGGAHGGRGGNAAGGGGSGGLVTYDAKLAPVDFGAGGGGGEQAEGGSGGGKLKLSASGTVAIAGMLSANGGNGGVHPPLSAAGDNGGGGAGGSVWIVAPSVSITGNVRAAGGNGAVCAITCTTSGGGGGGRIAIDWTTLYNAPGTIAYDKGAAGTGAARGTFCANGAGPDC